MLVPKRVRSTRPVHNNKDYTMREMSTTIAHGQHPLEINVEAQLAVRNLDSITQKYPHVRALCGATACPWKLKCASKLFRTASVRARCCVPVSLTPSHNEVDDRCVYALIRVLVHT